MIIQERITAQMTGDFVVFLIGMRINRLWKIHRWLPVVQAMPKMLRELYQRPDSGLLGHEMWFGRTTIMVQYWRSTEQLVTYAKDRASSHLPAWRAFNQAVGTNGDVGIWHETYRISPGSYENIYVNMPPFGLGRIGKRVSAAGRMTSAAGRFAADAREEDVS
ncbi:transcriptional regulator [Halothiobacillus diazotrophicus]|uniref:Transcriptional regulator n=1 Tax=Halothiobacillus diazotrophicus TaxID=1860122 RepID=A0A191ZIU7_9GAMM|nr:DUF4188 domain-containing protein [Halothiobacillus diazotrophicus]ANJ67800.1 transcriptional regulator [Halothiobacillus diazotrophicus]